MEVAWMITRPTVRRRESGQKRTRSHIRNIWRMRALKSGGHRRKVFGEKMGWTVARSTVRMRKAISLNLTRSPLRRMVR